MKPAGSNDSHLCYCSNIHPGETWTEVRRNLECYVSSVKQRISPSAPFGVGLRLSGAAAYELAGGESQDSGPLEEFRQWLTASGMYVFTINGFPYGKFHGTAVKQSVYRPDWLESERLAYSNRLAQILAALLPDEPGIYGSVSTVPGAFRSRVTNSQRVESMAKLLLAHAAGLARIRLDSGKTICLAIEPEPCCYLETIEETARFFETQLFTTDAIIDHAKLTGLGRDEAGISLRRHLGLCLDACHAAVEFEQLDQLTARLHSSGIAIHKIQLSAGLRIDDIDTTQADRLESFADDVYLHQVVERRGDRLTRYSDLPDALASLGRADDAVAATERREWRVHFHVPIFLNKLGIFDNTQEFLAELLERQRTNRLSAHLEVETYTWELLPQEFRGTDVVAAIARELEWVLARLNP